MNLKEQRLLIVASYLIILMLIFYPRLNQLVSSTESAFIGLSILNDEGITGNYFNSSESEITLGVKNSLLFGIDNHNNEPIYVKLKIRMSHKDGVSPQNQNHIPSPEKSIHEFSKIIDKYESIQIPFSFTVTQNNDTEFFKVKVQNNQLLYNLVLDESRVVKIIVELWKYNEDTGLFEFAQTSGESNICIWTQLYFYVNEM